ncbi:hypothetical protein EAO75_20220 [Streptomyces sp. uw30]|nr:hypothetical protein EAO75_20220 [Streptomyces sp. uw30]
MRSWRRRSSWRLPERSAGWAAMGSAGLCCPASAGALWLVAPPSFSTSLEQGDSHRGGAAHRHSRAPL